MTETGLETFETWGLVAAGSGVRAARCLRNLARTVVRLQLGDRISKISLLFDFVFRGFALGWEGAMAAKVGREERVRWLVNFCRFACKRPRGVYHQPMLTLKVH